MRYATRYRLRRSTTTCTEPNDRNATSLPISGERRKNAPGLARYVAALARRARPPSEIEVIDHETHDREKLMLGLRLDEPLALAEVGDVLDRKALSRLAARGLVEVSTNGRGEEISLSRHGRFLGGGVTADLLA